MANGDDYSGGYSGPAYSQMPDPREMLNALNARYETDRPWSGGYDPTRQVSWAQYDPANMPAPGAAPGMPAPAPGTPAGNFPNAGAPLAGQTGPPMPWSAVGAPASLQLGALPSMYEYAGQNPAEAARWTQASTPQGYAQMLAQARAAQAAQLAQATGRVPSPVPLPQEKPPVPVGMPGGLPLPGAPNITGGGTPAPAGGTTGFAGVQGAPGGPSGPANPPQPGYFGQIGSDLSDFWQRPVGHVLDRLPSLSLGGPAQAGTTAATATTAAPAQALPFPGAPRPLPGAINPFTGQPVGPIGPNPFTGQPTERRLSDREIAGMSSGMDILRLVTRSDLTDADRAALDRRLTQLQLGGR